MLPTFDNYTIMNELGSGQFGKVYKAKRKIDNKVIALKVIDIPADHDYLIEKTQEEIEALKTLSTPSCNPFVICYYGSSYDKDNRRFLVEMELVEGIEMKNYIDRLWNNNISRKVYYYLLLIAKDLLLGLKYTHQKNIIHNDIKLENIMIDTNNVPRIIDYGLSCMAIGTGDWGKYCTSHGGTPEYVAPEYIKDEVRLPASDLWALGITLYKAATNNKYPFDIYPGESILDLFDHIIGEEPKELNTKNDQLNELVNNLLVVDPKKRLTVDQGLEMLEIIERPAPIYENVSKTNDITFNTPVALSPPLSPSYPRTGGGGKRLDMEFGLDNSNLGFLTPERPETKNSGINNKPETKRQKLINSWLLL